MNNKKKQKIVDALINAGKGANLNSLANTLSWVQFEIPGVNSTEDSLHYEIRWSKFKDNASGHDGKTLYIELHAEKHNCAKKYKHIAMTKGLGRLEYFFYNSNRYVGFRIKGINYDLDQVLSRINGGNSLIHNIIQDVLSLDVECKRNGFY
jgi:hypothetical protein